MPYIFRDNKHRFRVLDGPIGKQLLAMLEELNLLGLGFLDTGMKGFLTKTGPLNHPEDFQQQHIGIICFCSGIACQNMTHQLSEYHLQVLGATGELIGVEEIATAWQAETLTGIEYTPLQQIIPSLVFSETLALTITSHSTLPDLIVVSKRWFDSLEPHIQQALIKASSLMARHQRERFANAQRQEYEALKARGVTLNTTIDYEDFWDAVQPLYQSIREQAEAEFTSILQGIQAVR
jgi:TRAP-type C4-dicarboxylate transport system substrate-binding protein